MDAVGFELHGLAVLFSFLFNLTVIVYVAAIVGLNPRSAAGVGALLALGGAAMSPGRIAEANLVVGSIAFSVGGAVLGGMGMGHQADEGNPAGWAAGIGGPLLAIAAAVAPGFFDMFIVYMAVTVVGILLSSSDVMDVAREFARDIDTFHLAWAVSIFIAVFATLYGALMWWPFPFVQAGFGLMGFYVGKSG